MGAPAEVVVRLLLLQHIRDWSCEGVEREVRANLVYRAFTRVGGGKVPDDTVMNKWALGLGAEVAVNISPTGLGHRLGHRTGKQDRERAQTARRYDRGGDHIHHPNDRGASADPCG